MSQNAAQTKSESNHVKPATVKERADLALNNDFCAKRFALPRKGCVTGNKKQRTIMDTGKNGVNVGGKFACIRSLI